MLVYKAEMKHRVYRIGPVVTRFNHSIDNIFRLSFPKDSTACFAFVISIVLRRLHVLLLFIINAAHLNTNFVSLFMSLLEDEINHLSNLIGRHGCSFSFLRFQTKRDEECVIYLFSTIKFFFSWTVNAQQYQNRQVV